MKEGDGGGWNHAAWVGSPGLVIHAGPSED